MINYLIDWLRARVTGFVPQEPDHRDFNYLISGGVLPEVVDLRENFHVSRDQKWLQACTGFATAGLIEYLLQQHYGKSYRDVSPLYLWFYGKKLHGWEGKNLGVNLRNSLKALYNHGFEFERNMPFKSNYLRSPLISNDITGYTTLKYLERTNYYTLTPGLAKDALSKGRPIVFGLKLNKSFYGNKSGIISNEKNDGSSHAMLLLGYDNINEFFIARNSWGSRWGDNGYCYIPFDYFFENAHNLWTIDEVDEK